MFEQKCKSDSGTKDDVFKTSESESQTNEEVTSLTVWGQEVRTEHLLAQRQCVAVTDELERHGSALTQLRSLWGDLSSTTSLTYLLQSRAVSARHSGTAVVQWTAGAARPIRLTLIIVLHCILMVGIALKDKPTAWEQPLVGVQMDVCTANSTLMWLAERV